MLKDQENESILSSDEEDDDIVGVTSLGST